MKALIASIALGLLATPAMAADPQADMVAVGRSFSGYFDAYYGRVEFEFGNFDDAPTVDTFGGALRANLPFAQAWNIQGDLTTDFVDTLFDDGGDTNYVYSVGGAAHLFWRDPDRFAFGGFAALTSYGVTDFDDLDLRSWKVGPEAQLYFGKLTLYGQAYYGQLEGDYFSQVNIHDLGVRGIARYYPTDNFRIEGEVGFHRSALRNGPGFDVDIDTFVAAAQAMYRFSNTPVSAFARYQFDAISNSVQTRVDDTDLHKVIVGVRLSLGSSTLIDEDRNGATMDTYVPNYVVPPIALID